MQTRRTFIGDIIAAGAAVLGQSMNVRFDPQPLIDKFGLWIASRHGFVSSIREMHSRILVDGKEVNAIEADDIEGWAIIDTDPTELFGKHAKVFGDVQILPGHSFGESEDWRGHAKILIGKPNTVLWENPSLDINFSRWAEEACYDGSSHFGSSIMIGYDTVMHLVHHAKAIDKGMYFPIYKCTSLPSETSSSCSPSSSFSISVSS